jgi:hypothetical protein
MANRTKKIKDELGNIASTVQERVDLFANRLEHVHQTPDYVGFDNGWKASVERYINQNCSSFIPNAIAEYSEPENGDDSPLVDLPTKEEVLHHLGKCKSKSGEGSDRVGYWLLKRAPAQYMSYLTKVFSSCVGLGYFPKEWKHAKTIMIPKPDKDHSIAKKL